MAGKATTPWIKMRSNLDTNPRVVAMAAELATTELHVIGMLWKVWSWLNQHCNAGNAVTGSVTLTVTEPFLDRLVLRDGFAAVLRKVGWLEGRDGALTFPRFAEHNGQAAKKREETAKVALRVARHRAAKKLAENAQNCNDDCNAVTGVTIAVTGVTPRAPPKKGAVLESINSLSSSPEGGKCAQRKERSSFKAPTVDEVRAYCQEKGYGFNPEAFVAHYEANGWVQSSGQRIKNWKAAAVGWQERWKKGTFEDGKKPPEGARHRTVEEWKERDRRESEKNGQA